MTHGTVRTKAGEVVSGVFWSWLPIVDATETTPRGQAFTVQVEDRVFDLSELDLCLTEPILLSINKIGNLDILKQACDQGWDGKARYSWELEGYQVS